MPEDLLKYGLIPEFVGRLPVVVNLAASARRDLMRVLTEPKNAVTRQFTKFLSLDKVELSSPRTRSRRPPSSPSIARPGRARCGRSSRRRCSR